MSDHAAESMKLKVVHTNKNGESSEPQDCRILTLDKIFAWIEKKDYDDAVKAELKKMVSNYPHNAYANFGKNFHKHLGVAQKNARNNRPLYTGELGDDSYKKINSIDDNMAPLEKKSNIKNLPSVIGTHNDFDDIEPPAPKIIDKEVIDVPNALLDSVEVKQPSLLVDEVPYGIHEVDKTSEDLS